VKLSHVGGIILLGGKSERMGTDKYLLPFFDSTLGRHLAGELQKVCSEVRCTAKYPHTVTMDGLPVHADLYDTDSALAGIHSGLSYSRTEWNFVTACDLPFFSYRVVEAMARHIQPEIDAIISKKSGFWEPLCALYSKNCLAPITQMLDQGAFEIKQLYSQIRIQSVDAAEIERQTHPHIFFNMNTREDYDLALRLQPTLPLL